MLLKLVPENTKFNFTRWRWHGVIISMMLNIASLAALFTIGLNFGVDFRGGVTIEATSAKPIDIGAVRDRVNALNLGASNVQELKNLSGGRYGVAVYVQAEQTKSAGGEASTPSAAAQQESVSKVQGALRQAIGADAKFERVDFVGATVSGELIQAGIWAVVAAVAMMVIYIWWRFEWQFGVAAVLSLVHDVLLTIGVLVLFQVPFDVSLIAALLTIVGYSVNDTVVVFDRIRENLRKYKKMPFQELVDLSINETLSRTIMTSLTTLIALVPLFFFGGEVLRGFSGAIIFGIFVGTYSSIYIASPFLMVTGVKREWLRGAAAPATP